MPKYQNQVVVVHSSHNHANNLHPGVENRWNSTIQSASVSRSDFEATNPTILSDKLHRPLCRRLPFKRVERVFLAGRTRIAPLDLGHGSFFFETEFGAIFEDKIYL